MPDVAGVFRLFEDRDKSNAASAAILYIFNGCPLYFQQWLSHICSVAFLYIFSGRPLYFQQWLSPIFSVAVLYNFDTIEQHNGTTLSL